MPNDYSVVRHARKETNPLKRSPKLPMPDMNKPGSTKPGYLIQHENRFDPNVLTPDEMMHNRDIKEVTKV